MEEKLFRAVIIQGLLDALNRFFWYSKSNKRYNKEALKWLGGEDFNYLCDLANVESSNVLVVFKLIKEHTNYLSTEDVKYLLNEQFNKL
jgi:hypothetical protein|tara:strand:- start:2049 stop:2315 length:267 start_codon:yes stop_codon:yes gene_type:complete